jgi:hypothetical protein
MFINVNLIIQKKLRYFMSETPRAGNNPPVSNYSSVPPQHQQSNKTGKTFANLYSLSIPKALKAGVAKIKGIILPVLNRVGLAENKKSEDVGFVAVINERPVSAKDVINMFDKNGNLVEEEQVEVQADKQEVEQSNLHAKPDAKPNVLQSGVNKIKNIISPLLNRVVLTDDKKSKEGHVEAHIDANLGIYDDNGNIPHEPDVKPNALQSGLEKIKNILIPIKNKLGFTGDKTNKERSITTIGKSVNADNEYVTEVHEADKPLEEKNIEDTVKTEKQEIQQSPKNKPNVFRSGVDKIKDIFVPLKNKLGLSDKVKIERSVTVIVNGKTVDADTILGMTFVNGLVIEKNVLAGKTPGTYVVLDGKTPGDKIISYVDRNNEIQEKVFNRLPNGTYSAAIKPSPIFKSMDEAVVFLKNGKLISDELKT